MKILTENQINGMERGRKATRRLRLNALSAAVCMARMIDQENPATLAGIVDESGLSPATVRRYIHALHAKGVIYIAMWENDCTGRPSIPAYAIGQKPDAKRKTKPKSVSNKEQVARLRTARLLGLMRQTVEVT